LVVEGFESGRYGGATRQVATALYNGSSGNLTEILSGKWDRSTGLLCEASLRLEGPDGLLQTAILLCETSRWGIVRRSNWLILLVVAVVAAVASVLVVGRQWPTGRR
jgi:hypothetical protein